CAKFYYGSLYWYFDVW
nr:immunoglobulin heavy chain junction region [Mus musculus]